MYAEFGVNSLTLGNEFQEYDSMALQFADKSVLQYIEVNDLHVAAHTGLHLHEPRIPSDSVY